MMKVPTPLGADSPGTGRFRRLEGARLRRFQRALLAWYGPRARPLRIRTTRDPWAILVSEVMAQQTQIARVDDAWTRFMQRFPTSRDVAAAPTGDVLRAWAGLGYNRRAVNLQRAAVAIETEHGGRVPDQVVQLEALPGIGPYTARAVAAIAYDVPVAPVDTNVRRVITRVLGEPLTVARLQLEADRLLPRKAAAAWTHASMELGATVCVAQAPHCDACPLRAWCASVDQVTPGRDGQATAAMPFEQTTRWLRGRIVDQLRGLEDGAWGRLAPAIGGHAETAIRAAVAGLERDGLLERHPDGSVRLPSGTT
jgi:A/G-specific adenine glycosylase